MFISSLLNNQYNGFIRQNKSGLIALVKAIDILIIIITYHIFINEEKSHIEDKQALILISSVLTFLFFSTFNNLYGIPRGVRFLFICKNIVTAWSASIFSTAVFSLVSQYIDYSNIQLYYPWIIITPVCLIGWHFFLRLVLIALRKIGINSKSTVIFGATRLGLDLQSIILKEPWMGLNLIGFFDDRKPGVENRTTDVNVIGTFDDLVKKAKNNEIDVIFITLPMRSEKRIKSIIDDLGDSSTVVYYIPDLFVFDLLGSKIENYNGLPSICVYDIPHAGIDGISKRILDIGVSSIILCLIALPMLAISIGIKLTSPGPIFFAQKRYGLRGEEIKVLKFRTMTVCEDGNNVKQATRGDSRITPFGEFLRRTSLDELPQFFNTLHGTMSIVGPRPHAVMHNEMYRSLIKGYMLRHNVKPGITGLAQIRGFRGETDTIDKMERRIRSDLEYIHYWSVWMDIEIIFKTIFKGFVNKNAY